MMLMISRVDNNDNSSLESLTSLSRRVTEQNLRILEQGHAIYSKTLLNIKKAASRLLLGSSQD